MFIKIKFTSKLSGRVLEKEVHLQHIVESFGEDDLIEKCTKCDCQALTECSMYTDCDCYEEWIDCEVEYSI